MKLLLLGMIVICCGISSLCFAHTLNQDFAEPRTNVDECAEFMDVNLAMNEIKLKASNGGTSAYAKVILPGHDSPSGCYLPPNSSGIIDGEVTAYRVALLLGAGKTVQVANLKAVQGAELARMQKFMTDTVWSHAAQIKNQKNIVSLIAEDLKAGKPLFGALKCWNRKPYDFDELLSPDHNGLKADAKETQWIRSSLPQPTEASYAKTMETVSVISTEVALAKELSTHFLIDAIMGQWDRFSGGNLQLMVAPGGVLHFGLFDNGGTWGDDKDVLHTLSFVTRFDRKVADTILDLDQSICQKQEFHGATDQELKEFLQMDQDFSGDNWDLLKHNITLTADHIRKVNAPDSQKYFVN